MENDEIDFQSLFYEFQKCHSLIHDMDLSRKKDHPMMELFEAFSLCSGAFFNLFLYSKNYPDLFKNSQKKNHESWIIFGKTQDYQTFCSDFQPHSEIIQSDFRSMSIANAALRLSAAGELVCDVIQKIDLNECEICKSQWPYQRFFDPDNRRRSWNRQLLHKKDRKGIDKLSHDILLRNLSLLVTL